MRPQKSHSELRTHSIRIVDLFLIVMSNLHQTVQGHIRKRITTVLWSSHFIAFVILHGSITEEDAHHLGYDVKVSRVEGPPWRQPG